MFKQINDIKARANSLTRKHTAFPLFSSLLDQSIHGYRPTIIVSKSEEHKELADLYDFAMMCRDSGMRAHRVIIEEPTPDSKSALEKSREYRGKSPDSIFYQPRV